MVGQSRPDGRARILTEATRCFARRGLDGTSLQEIADAVGVRKPSVLHHFPSKEALYQSVLEHMLASFGETLPRLLKAAARPETKTTRFDAIIDETLDFFAADPDRARLLLREALDHPDDMRELVQKAAMPWITIIAESIRKAQRDGAMRRGADPEAYLVHIINMVIGLFSAGPILQVILGSNVKKNDRLVKELKRIAKTALIERKS